jgi:hypothetical protein
MTRDLAEFVEGAASGRALRLAFWHFGNVRESRYYTSITVIASPS